MPKVHFATNPCRIKFFGQEIVIFREDTMARMLRNTIRVKADAEGEDLRRYVSGFVFNLMFFKIPTINIIGAPAGVINFGPEPSQSFDIEYPTISVGL